MIKKSVQAGESCVTYVPFVDRTKRSRYTKKRMVRPPNALTGWFRDLLRGGPNPFLASPLATRIDQRLKIEKQARGASGPVAAWAIGTQLNAALNRYVRQAIGEAHAELDRLDGYLTEEENCLRACSPSEIKAAIVPIHELMMDYENVVDQHHDNLKDIEEASKLLASVCAAHTGASEVPLDVDVDGPRSHINTRLKRYLKRASDMIGSRDMDPVTDAEVNRVVPFPAKTRERTAQAAVRPVKVGLRVDTAPGYSARDG